jgi:beta-1,4-mannosyltransferase
MLYEGNAQEGVRSAAHVTAPPDDGNPSAAGLRIIAHPGFSQKKSNPYTWALYSHLRASGAVVQDFSLKRLLSSYYDVWHLHWPEGHFWRGDLTFAIRRSIELLVLLSIARLRGTRIVWTVHNLQSHEQPFPRLERWFWRSFVRLVDGFVSLSHSGVKAAESSFPGLRKKDRFVIPHGHYRGIYPDTQTRAEAREALRIPAHARVVAFFGQVRPYKNVTELVEAVRSIDDPDLIVLVAGCPNSSELEARVRAAAGGDARVRLFLTTIPEEEVQLYLKSADLVVLPYQEILNSGSALLALSFSRRVLVPGLGSMAELQEHVGSAWVRTYQGPLTAELLADSLRWSRSSAEDAVAPLQSLDWPGLARLTMEAYRAIIDRTGSGPTSQEGTERGEHLLIPTSNS